MGRNRPRSRAVDVTKSLLQPTSITDHIAVQVAQNQVIQVSEEDLSPTQGSEAAFALRREGKLDATMKLCLNWRQGNCHNHAACSFAHIIPYFGVSSDNGISLSAPGKPVAASYGAPVVSFSGDGGIRSGPTNTVSAGSWSHKLAPPSYTAISAPHQRVEEKTGDDFVAHSFHHGGGLAAEFAEPKRASGGPPGPPSTSVQGGTSVISRLTGSALPPAVLSPEGLNSILTSLAVAWANKTPSSESVEGGDEAHCASNRAWLHEMAAKAEAQEGAAASAGSARGKSSPELFTDEDFTREAGAALLEETLWDGKNVEEFYHVSVERALEARATQFGRSPGALCVEDEAMDRAAVGFAGGSVGSSDVFRNHRMFSTAPISAVSGNTAGQSPITEPWMVARGRRVSGEDDGIVAPLSYHVMKSLEADDWT